MPLILTSSKSNRPINGSKCTKAVKPRNNIYNQGICYTVDCWKPVQYAKEAPLYTCPVIVSFPSIQYLTTVKKQIQARQILPSLKKCLRGLKKWPPQIQVFVLIQALVEFTVISGLAQRNPMDPWQSLMPQMMPSLMNDFILAGRMKSRLCWNQQEFWHTLQWKQDLTSRYLHPMAQVPLTHQASSWWLPEYSAWNDKELFEAQSFVACSSTQHGGKSLRITGLYTKTAYKNILAWKLWNWSATVTY